MTNLKFNSIVFNADSLYIQGRFLWLSKGLSGGGILLWLGCEQLVKVLIIQKSDQFIIDTQNKSDKDTNTVLEKFMKELTRGKHDGEFLLNKLLEEYPELDIKKFKKVLTHLNQIFERRYVKFNNKSFATYWKDLILIDEFYFLARSYLSPKIQCSLIDEIFMKTLLASSQSLPIYEYAYKDNIHFKGRECPEVNFRDFETTPPFSFSFNGLKVYNIKNKPTK